MRPHRKPAAPNCTYTQDSWEDSDAEEAPKALDTTGPLPPLRQKGITKAKIAEREAAETARIREIEEQNGEDSSEKKRRERQMQMQQDLENARSLFGDATIAAAAAAAGNPNGVSLSLLNGGETPNDALAAFSNPKTKQDFEALSEALAKQIIDLHGSKPLYAHFVDTFVRALCLPLKDLDVKKSASTLTALGNEKQRLAKEASGTGKKGGKGKVKPSLGAMAAAGGAKTAVTGRG